MGHVRLVDGCCSRRYVRAAGITAALLVGFAILRGWSDGPEPVVAQALPDLPNPFVLRRPLPPRRAPLKGWRLASLDLPAGEPDRAEPAQPATPVIQLPEPAGIASEPAHRVVGDLRVPDWLTSEPPGTPAYDPQDPFRGPLLVYSFSGDPPYLMNLSAADMLSRTAGAEGPSGGGLPVPTDPLAPVVPVPDLVPDADPVMGPVAGPVPVNVPEPGLATVLVVLLAARLLPRHRAGSRPRLHDAG